MFNTLIDPIVGLCQRMIKSGRKYIILDSSFYNQRGELVVPIQMCSTGRKIQYKYDHVLRDYRLIQQRAEVFEFMPIKAKDGAKNGNGCGFNQADTKRL